MENIDTGEPITDLKLGNQVLRLRGIVLELLTKIGHVDANVVRALDVPRPPDVQQQLAMRKHLAMPADQGSQKTKFDWR